MDESARRRGTPAVNPSVTFCYGRLSASQSGVGVHMDESARRSDLFRDPNPF